MATASGVKDCTAMLVCRADSTRTRTYVLPDCTTAAELLARWAADTSSPAPAHLATTAGAVLEPADDLADVPETFSGVFSLLVVEAAPVPEEDRIAVVVDARGRLEDRLALITDRVRSLLAPGAAAMTGKALVPTGARLEASCLPHAALLAAPVAVTVRLSQGRRCVARAPALGSVADLVAAVRAREAAPFVLMLHGRSLDPDAPLADVGLRPGDELTVVPVAKTMTVTLRDRGLRWTVHRPLRFSQLMAEVAARTTIRFPDLVRRRLRCNGCGRTLSRASEQHQLVPANCCRVASLDLEEPSVRDAGTQKGRPAARVPHASASVEPEVKNRGIQAVPFWHQAGTMTDPSATSEPWPPASGSEDPGPSSGGGESEICRLLVKREAVEPTLLALPLPGRTTGAELRAAVAQHLELEAWRLCLRRWTAWNRFGQRCTQTFDSTGGATDDPRRMAFTNEAGELFPGYRGVWDDLEDATCFPVRDEEPVEVAPGRTSVLLAEVAPPTAAPCLLFVENGEGEDFGLDMPADVPVSVGAVRRAVADALRVPALRVGLVRWTTENEDGALCVRVCARPGDEADKAAWCADELGRSYVWEEVRDCTPYDLCVDDEDFPAIPGWRSRVAVSLHRSPAKRCQLRVRRRYGIDVAFAPLLAADARVKEVRELVAQRTGGDARLLRMWRWVGRDRSGEPWVHVCARDGRCVDAEEQVAWFGRGSCVRRRYELPRQPQKCELKDDEPLLVDHRVDAVMVLYVS